MTASGDLNSATAGNNAGSVNTQAQTPAGQMARQAQNNAYAATNPQRYNNPQANAVTPGGVTGPTTGAMNGNTVSGTTTGTTTGTVGAVPAQ
jgi:hypothetical protein